MASWKTYFIIKLMTLWNFIKSSSKSLYNKIQNIYKYTTDYFNGHHDIWVFISGHTFPVSLNNINNDVYINWIYDNYYKSLSLNDNKDTNKIKCKFSWLSAKIRIKNSDKYIDYDIDNFIEDFFLETYDNNTPSLYIIFMCWCAYTKHWFKSDDIIEFHIIDNNGEEHILNVEEHHNSLYINYDKIYFIIHPDKDSNVQNNIDNHITDENIQKYLIKDNISTIH
jgi:hypothetical protein